MPQPNWDITDEASHRNVLHILSDLAKVTAIPTEATEALRKYIRRLESENHRLLAENERLRNKEKNPTNGSKMLTVHVEQGQYRKVQPLIKVSWTCPECGKLNEREQLPGGIPRYCLPGEGEIESKCQRAARQRAVDRQREKRHAARAAKAQSQSKD